MVNLELIKNVIGTKYNDMRSLAAVDGHDRSYLNRMCSDNGINLNDWFLIGLEFYDSEPIGKYQITAHAYLVKKAKVDEGFDELKGGLTQLESVEIHKKNFSISYGRSW